MYHIFPGVERVRSQRSLCDGQDIVGRLLGDLDPRQKTAERAARATWGTATGTDTRRSLHSPS